MAVAVIVWASVVIAQGAERIVLEGPKDAKAEDLKKCADAMQRRCEAYGYHGVEGTVDGGSVVLRVTGGFSEAMLQRVEAMGRAAAKEVYWATTRLLTEAEREQFGPNLKDATKDRAPRGCRWIRAWTSDYEPNDDAAGLIIESTKMTMTTADVRDFSDAREDACSFSLSKDLSSKLRARMKNGENNFTLIVDGRCSSATGTFWLIDNQQKPLERIRWSITNGKLLRPTVMHPMPFALARKRE